MKNKFYWLLAFAFMMIGALSFSNNATALTKISSGIKLVKHFKNGDNCGVGKDCFVDNDGDGEVQGFTLTPTHIVISFLIDEGGYKPTTRSRIYFIDRKTFKVVKMIPEKRHFSCSRYGDPGCYGHASSFAYNYTSGKLLLATQAGTFAFDDVTMKYEKRIDGVGSAKLAYNQTYDWYWTGNEGHKIKDGNLKTIKDTKTDNYSGTEYEEGPATWGNYLVVNDMVHGHGAVLRFYNHKENKHVKDIEISESAVKTGLIEGMAFGSDGGLFMMVPTNNDRTGWGHGAAIYAVSGKTLGISESTNVDINNPLIVSDPKGGCDPSDVNCECGIASTRKHLDPKDNPPVTVAPTRQIQCTSILPGSLCSPTNSTASIGSIINGVIDFLTISAGMAGTLGVLFTGYIVMTAAGDSGKLVSAKNRFYAIVIGLVLWCGMSIVLDLLIMPIGNFSPVVDTGDNSGSASGGGNGGSSGGGMTVTSSVQPTCIKLNMTDIKVGVGDSKTIGYTIYPANATNIGVTWTSDDEKIATVSAGKVKGVKVGETTITARTANGKSAKVKVTVTGKSSTKIGKKYGVYLGLDYSDKSKLSRLYNHDHVVIDFQEGFPKAFIDELHAKGIKVYSYLNVGAIEWTDGSRYYSGDKRFKNLILGKYEGWDAERWVDASSKVWQNFITEELEPKLRAKGADGYYIDNLDVYYYYKNKKSGLYAGLQNILRKIHSRGMEVMINGADDFVTRSIQDGSYKELFDGVNQEEVFSDNDGNKQNSEDTEYLKKYLKKVKAANLFVYLLEYGDNKDREKTIKSYCNLNGFGYYYSSRKPFKELI